MLYGRDYDDHGACACGRKLTEDDHAVYEPERSRDNVHQPECYQCRGDDVLNCCPKCGEFVREGEDHTFDLVENWAIHARCVPQEVVA